MDENTSEYYESKVDYESKLESYTITNTHTPMTITYNLTKNWDDLDNQDGVRPDSITVTITGKTSQTTVYTKTVTVTEGEDGKWTYSFTDLPKYNNKELVQYTITEDAVESYTTGTIKDVINEEETTVLNNDITNTHEVERTSISGTKTWDDENNKLGIRPNEITINLYANGVLIDTRKVTMNENWIYTFKDLFKFKNGLPITYTIKEEKVEGYITTINGYDITNTLEYGKGGDIEVLPPQTGIKESNHSYIYVILVLVNIMSLTLKKLFN